MRCIIEVDLIIAGGLHVGVHSVVIMHHLVVKHPVLNSETITRGQIVIQHTFVIKSLMLLLRRDRIFLQTSEIDVVCVIDELLLA